MHPAFVKDIYTSILEGLSLFAHCLASASTRPTGSSLIQRVTVMDSCCGNVRFTVENPVLLLNGSVEVVGGYVYQTKGYSCDMKDVQANVSIREGIPIGAVL